MILAIDCGSTNHKAALFDRSLRRLADCSTPLVYSMRHGGHVAFEPSRFWEGTLALMRHACASARIQPREIRTISITSQAQSFTILNEAGECLMPFLSWADKRAQAESRELAETLSTDFHKHCGFPQPVPQLLLCKLLWVARHMPDMLPSGRIVTLQSFLAFRLAGLHVTDSNLAAMSGLYSLAAKQWWAEALDICSAKAEQCGEIIEIGTALRARCQCHGLELSPELAVVLAGNDQTAGAYANDVRAGSVVLTLGTALAAYRFAGEQPGPFSQNGCWGPYPQGGFYELAARDEGCAALDWAVARLMPGNEAAFFQAAGECAGGGGFFFPERIHGGEPWNCVEDAAARARAVLEGICFSMRTLVEGLAPSDPRQAPAVVIGGGCASEFWLQMLADVLGQPLRRGEGDNLLGAAMLAVPGVPVSESRKRARVFAPRPDFVKHYEEMYHQWQHERERDERT
jgi:xylulokinase